MAFLKRLLNLGRDERLARDIDREIAFHLRERVEELRAAGHDEADAVLLARRQFGNRTYQAERTREADLLTWVDSVRGDLRYALRALRRSPAFTAVAVASLALGIGANTAIYSLIDAVVLRTLPVPAPHELAQVTGGEQDESGYFTNPLWEAIRDRQTGFSAMAAFSETNFNVADGGEVRRINGAWVSGDYFRLFGVRPLVGRLPTAQDDVRGCPATAVVSHGFWASEYGSRPDIVGQGILLDGARAQIIGVAAPGFEGAEVGRATRVYVPLCAMAALRGNSLTLDARSNWWLRIMGRRDPAVTLDQARARLQAIAPDVYAATVPQHWGAESMKEYRERTLGLHPRPNGLSGVRTRYSTPLLIMMGAVGLVLLIASANVANLLLARAAARQREIAIRLAIGAGRRRLVRQLVTESVLLALMGAIAGLVLAQWGTGALVSLISSDASPVSLDLSFSWRVLAFTAVVAALTATLFGIVPAWRGTRVSPQVAMKANARGVAEGHGRFTIGKSLVVAQVALSLTLLVGAGLLVGSLRNLSTLDPGFRAEGILVTNTNFRRAEIPRDQGFALGRQLVERVRQVPGVIAVSTTSRTPVGSSTWNNEVFADGHTTTEFAQRLVWFNEVSRGYFATLGTPLLAGRDFEDTDVPTSPLVAIINASAARRFFGDSSPLGRQFRTKAGDIFDPPYTVVGVVADSKYRSLREDESGTVYLPESQNASGTSGVTMLVRTAGDPTALIPSIKGIFAEVNRNITLEFGTLEHQLAESLQRERMLAMLSALFGGVALALSMLGLYGVMAYTVARRRNEIGVRIALGAANGRVLRMVLGDVSRVVLVGIALGVAGALASGKLVRSFLYGVEPAEPVVLAGAAALLAVVALGAGFIPAWRASRVDPVTALREE